MPLKKLAMKPGVNRENTRYTNENGWYDGDKIRFRQGTPEKIGGWQAISFDTYLGVCRSFWPWTDNAGTGYLGVGTNLKYYIQYAGAFYDITPITTIVPATFSATNGSTTITVTSASSGVAVGDFVTFSGAVSLGGDITATVLNQNYQVITVIDINNYTITTAVSATALDTGNGGSACAGAYEVATGLATQIEAGSWGIGPWGIGNWSTGSPNVSNLRVWNAQNFGQDLIFGPKGGGLYYWPAPTLVPITTSVSRGFPLSAVGGWGAGAWGAGSWGLSNTPYVPIVQNLLIVSDTSRFVLVFGTNDLFGTELDPMLIRWSNQESAVDWLPSPTNQAGSLRLSHGSKIMAVAQTRQEILVWTDTSLYSLQYLGAPLVWGSTLLSDNITILSDRAPATASGVTYWMGADKFYRYDGRVSTLNCDLLRYIFDDTPGFNTNQNQQIFASTVEKFNEIWWFYCSAASDTVDRYAVFNYGETSNIWYYGTMERTAWVDVGVLGHYPISADSTHNRLLYQELGVDDNSTPTPASITSYITSAEFDLDDGNNFAFVWRVLPDITFRGSTAVSPALTMYLLPLANSGSGYNNNTSTNSNQSVASTSLAPITRTGTYPVEQFTGQINTRVRGRQMSIKVESTALGVQWQLGSPRIDVRTDGRR